MMRFEIMLLSTFVAVSIFAADPVVQDEKALAKERAQIEQAQKQKVRTELTELAKQVSELKKARKGDAAKAWAAEPGKADDEEGVAEATNAAINPYGVEWLYDGIYYEDYTGVVKLAPFIVDRLNELKVNK